MRNHRIASSIVAVSFALALAACSKGSDSPTQAATNPTTISYAGVFAGTKDGGTFTLSATVTSAVVLAQISAQSNSGTVAATGTLKVTGGSTVTLAGTYNTATKVFTMSGSSYALTATVAYTGPSSTTGTVSALPTSSTVTVTNYCGTYSGSESGRWSITISGSKLAGSASTPDGGVSLSGSAVGNSLSMFWHPNSTDNGNALGTISGTTVSGTWTSNTPGDHGTWTGSSGSC
jgi:hypothetical protein